MPINTSYERKKSEAFCGTKCVSGEAGIQCFKMVDGFGRWEKGKNIGLLEIAITSASVLPELVL